jgi:hypothetical protein
LSDWLVTAVNHRLKQYKHPLLLALVLLALNTAFFVSMTYYLADGPELAGVMPGIAPPMETADPVFQQAFDDHVDRAFFTLTK